MTTYANASVITVYGNPSVTPIFETINYSVANSSFIRSNIIINNTVEQMLSGGGGGGGATIKSSVTLSMMGV